MNLRQEYEKEVGLLMESAVGEKQFNRDYIEWLEKKLETAQQTKTVFTGSVIDDSKHPADDWDKNMMFSKWDDDNEDWDKRYGF